MIRNSAWMLGGLLLAGCTSQPTGAEYGQELFESTSFSASQFNEFSCSSCHLTTPTPDPTRIDSGYSLYDTAFRPSWYGGGTVRLLDAVNFCYVSFMRGVAPLQPEDPEAKALYEYLVSISPNASAPALPMTVVTDVADVPRGDRARGEQVYQAACQSCHGSPHTGDGRNELAIVLPEYTASYPQQFPGVAPGLVVIEKVRHGQFFGIGGNMPFYSLEALSNEDLGALLTFLDL